MRSKLLLALFSAAFCIAVASAHQEKKEKKPLKNSDIVQMAQNHFDDDTLLKLIEISNTDFDISGDALIDLKNQGVSSAVIRAMLEAARKQVAASTPAAAPDSTPSDTSSASAATTNSGAANPASTNSPAATSAAPTPAPVTASPMPSSMGGAP